MFLNIPYISFMTPATTTDFWDTLKAILFVGMPLVLIAAGTHFAGHFLSVIRNAFRRDSLGHDDEDKRRDRDYDI